MVGSFETMLVVAVGLTENQSGTVLSNSTEEPSVVSVTGCAPGTPSVLVSEILNGKTPSLVVAVNKKVER